MLYLADSEIWASPPGSVMPAPLRWLVSAPLAVESALERVAAGGSLLALAAAAIRAVPAVVALGALVVGAQHAIARALGLAAARALPPDALEA